MKTTTTTTRTANTCDPANLMSAGRGAFSKIRRTLTHVQPSPYVRPASLLSKGETNAKLSKNAEFGYDSYILYLAPYTQNSKGVNLCPHASEQCAAACLFTAGRGAFSNVANARLNKTEYYLHDRILFIDQLLRELNKINSKPGRHCVRLNGTSDIDFMKVIKASGFGDPLEMFQNITFYDYTKSIQRIRKYAGTRYHLTFSRSENNELECLQALSLGANVAAVFDELPAAYYGRPVVDGDLSDLRFMDQPGVVVGLKAKGKARKGSTGFVIRTK